MMISHDSLKSRALADAKTRAEYDALGPEFELLNQLLKARKKAGLTQAAVAERMGTKAPAVARLESSLASEGHSPSIATLRRYADAVGKRLVIRLA